MGFRTKLNISDERLISKKVDEAIEINENDESIINDSHVLFEEEISLEEDNRINRSDITTETIYAEDNKIVLNFGGTHETSQMGGFVLIDGVSEGVDSTISTNEKGDWYFSPGIISDKIIIPKANINKMSSLGSIQWDEDFLYIKTETGIKKVKLEDI